MFGFLKDKIKKAVQSITEKFEKKEPLSEHIQEKPIKEMKQEEIKAQIEIRKEIEEIKELEPEIVEEVKEEVLEQIPETEEIEKTLAPEQVEETEKISPKIPSVKPIEVKPELVIQKEVVEKPKKKGFFEKVLEKVGKKVAWKKLSEKDVVPVLNDLETGLIESDVAYEVAEKIKNDLKNNLVDKEIKRGTEREVVISSMRQSLLEILSVPKIDLEEIIKKTKVEERPAVLLFLGFNGSGKTTSIAKIGKWLQDKGYTIAIAAADTWRKAAIEQIEEHAKKLGIDLIKHTYGADPAAVVYDGIEHCKARKIDVLLSDSAGRTHINKNLIDELKKIIRVGKPDLKILVMDSLVGNDAVPQSQMFNDAVGVDAVVFTKNDVNTKGGAILSVSYLLKKPILFLGTGQNHSDLIEFDSTKFVEELLGE